MDVWTQQIAAVERHTRRLRATAAALLDDRLDTTARDSPDAPADRADFESFPHPVPLLTTQLHARGTRTHTRTETR
jgi:hypothetical protein